ncbi:hypothetical protein MCOR25_005370 [Pyricularia grisea]|nr:hypothetical protein MCOR25_005370 [Pyricularia grisea]
MIAQHLGHSEYWAEGVRIVSHHVPWRLNGAEDDIELLSQVLLLWLKASTAPLGMVKK